MMFQRSTSRLLHDEHLVTIATLDAVERTLLSRRDAPAPGDAEAARVIARLSRMSELEVNNHFDFEENHLFPILIERGDGGMTEVLSEEHEILRETGRELLDAARAGAAGFTPESWRAYRRLCAEMVERMIGHIQKEEMALLPILEDVLDADLDAELAALHGG
jgi:hemerythrin-like domain-containing protein